jgi:hypothetical protein
MARSKSRRESKNAIIPVMDTKWGGISHTQVEAIDPSAEFKVKLQDQGFATQQKKFGQTRDIRIAN